uniref:Adaptor-related protein complex 3, mu 1 subunit n=1 Tax=Pan troglodytes TaxID=9598 RepID=K7CH25_PANTR
MDRNPPFF